MPCRIRNVTQEGLAYIPLNPPALLAPGDMGIWTEYTAAQAIAALSPAGHTTTLSDRLDIKDSSDTVDAGLLPTPSFDLAITFQKGTAQTGKILVPAQAGKLIALQDFAILSPGTAWSIGMTKLVLEDDAGSPVEAYEIAIAALAGSGAVVRPGSANTTPEAGWVTGLTAGKNLWAKGDNNATNGSDLTIRARGIYV